MNNIGYKYTVYANAKGKTVDILMKKNQLG